MWAIKALRSGVCDHGHILLPLRLPAPLLGLPDSHCTVGCLTRAVLESSRALLGQTEMLCSNAMMA